MATIRILPALYMLLNLINLSLLGVIPSTSYANVGDMFGFGARTASLAGADVAGGFDGYAAYSNPASLARPQVKRLVLSYGIQYAQPVFMDISGVLVQNNFNSDADTYGNVDTSYKSTFGQSVGLSYRLFPEFHDFTFGVVTFLPLIQTAYMDSGETYVPEYLLYRSRSQRPQFEFGFGSSVGNGFHVGLGLHMAFSLTSNATVFLQANPARASSMRFTSTLKPKLSPYIGFLFIEPTEEQKYSAGIVVRAPVSSPNAMVLNSGARVLGNFAALDFNFKANSALYYDPGTIELGGVIKTGPRERTLVQLDYQFWHLFQSPALIIENPSVTQCTDPISSQCNPPGITISPTLSPTLNLRNILIPRIAEELTFEKLVLRFGYAYRPSIFSGPPTEVGNMLDPSKHILNAGVGFQFKKFLDYDVPCTIDLNVSYHQLVSQTVTKSPGNETGAAGSKVGSPGYTAGGRIFASGVALTMAF